jgi:hypothetical protein
MVCVVISKPVILGLEQEQEPSIPDISFEVYNPLWRFWKTINRNRARRRAGKGVRWAGLPVRGVIGKRRRRT